MRTFLGYLLGLLVRLWVATLRLRLDLERGFDADADEPVVFGFWHGEQMSLLAALRLRRGPRSVMVSHSKDGDLQAGVMRALGFSVVRGSSSRGGAAAQRALLRALRAGRDVMVAEDGPRGPRGVPKPGAAQLAKRAGARHLRLRASARKKITLEKTWDRFQIPIPFTTVTVTSGPREPAQPHAHDLHRRPVASAG